MYKQNSETYDGQFSQRFTLNGGTERVKIFFSELALANGTAGSFVADDVTLLAFFAYGPGAGQGARSVDLEIANLRFAGGSVANETEAGIAARTVLEGAFPNPFASSATIGFTLASRQDVTLAVYDVLGRQVATLASGSFAQGQHSVSFEAQGLSAGTYFYRLVTPEGTHTKTLTLVR